MAGTEPTEERTEEPVRLTDMDEEPPEQLEDEEHTPVFSPPLLHPVANSSVSWVLAETNKEKQCTMATEIHKFLQLESLVLTRLNEWNLCYVGVVNVPKSKHV